VYGSIGYAMDENEHIIGLNLDNSQIQDILFLKDLTNLTVLELRGNENLACHPIHPFFQNQERGSKSAIFFAQGTISL